MSSTFRRDDWDLATCVKTFHTNPSNWARDMVGVTALEAEPADLPRCAQPPLLRFLSTSCGGCDQMSEYLLARV
jgi:hypothetical protein